MVELPSRARERLAGIRHGERQIRKVGVLHQVDRPKLAVAELILLRGDRQDELHQGVDTNVVQL